jgi:hypothetical protein
MPSGISTGQAPARCAYGTAAFNRLRPATGSPCRTLAARAMMTPVGPCLTSGPRLPDWSTRQTCSPPVTHASLAQYLHRRARPAAWAIPLAGANPTHFNDDVVTEFESPPEAGDIGTSQAGLHMLVQHVAVRAREVVGDLTRPVRAVVVNDQQLNAGVADPTRTLMSSTLARSL